MVKLRSALSGLGGVTVSLGPVVVLGNEAGVCVRVCVCVTVYGCVRVCVNFLNTCW